jgi:hypothetical protein
MGAVSGAGAATVALLAGGAWVELPATVDDGAGAWLQPASSRLAAIACIKIVECFMSLPCLVERRCPQSARAPLPKVAG